MKKTESRAESPAACGGALEQLRTAFGDDWSAGRQPSIEAFLGRIDPPARPDLLRELVRAELRLRQQAGEEVRLWEYYQRFPNNPQSVDAAIRSLSARGDFGTADGSGNADDETIARTHGVASSEQLAGLISEGWRGGAGEMRQIGHFQLLEQLGEGRFGSVWKARDPKLDRIVAIKIPRDAGRSQRQIDLFLREARSAAQVRHPNIVSIHEVGRDGDAVFMATEFIQGVDLRQYLALHGATSARKAAEFCVQVAEALECAHEAGVIHRDLKPSNIMVDLQGQPHIADFGLAKRQADLTMTVEGQVIGTPAYMSPEQARGKGRTADRRTDVYSLGVILFEMLTGELPFRGDRHLLMMQKLQLAAPGPRELNRRVPRDLDTVCLKCLERDERKRYPGCGELADDLQRYLRGVPILARPVGPLTQMVRGYLNPKTSSMTAAGYLIFLAFILLLWGGLGWIAAVAGQWEVDSLSRLHAEAGILVGGIVLPIFVMGLKSLSGSRAGQIGGAAWLTLLAAGSALLMLHPAPGRFSQILAPGDDASLWLLCGLLFVVALIGLVVQGVALIQSPSEPAE